MSTSIFQIINEIQKANMFYWIATLKYEPSESMTTSIFQIINELIR